MVEKKHPVYAPEIDGQGETTSEPTLTHIFCKDGVVNVHELIDCPYCHEAITVKMQSGVIVKVIK